MTGKKLIEKIREEIERMKKINKVALERGHITDEEFHGRNQAQNHLSYFLGTLEVDEKEVDLEKELDRYLRGEFQQTAGGNFNNYIQVARHFYELGKNAK